MNKRKIELLSPARNCEQGREAINHGADAVYIGAAAYGARAAAGNSVSEIEQLARYAHIYHAKVFATVNTLLFDEEVEKAVSMLHQLYDAGVDAAIIQDMGLLECDLPPIELHASTQTHMWNVERVKFMQDVGFSRVILARETPIELMRTIRQETSVELEAFVQGALCVSYSGQCYMSQYLTGRSGNRGCCSQPCRSSYDLYNGKGECLVRDQHLLSLKDFSAARHIRNMIDAGITSFKIEGRLKDMAYVKNVTAYYRQLIDKILEERLDLTAASSGRCQIGFTPDLEKTFNRGFTDYFLVRRQPMSTKSTQKSIGKHIGKVTGLGKRGITVDSKEKVAVGDGLCYWNSNGKLEGFKVDSINGNILVPNRMPEDIEIGTEIWRNHDEAFERMLQNPSSSRKIAVNMTLDDTDDGLQLTIDDGEGVIVTASVTATKEPARQPETAKQNITKQLSKLGDTAFVCTGVTIEYKPICFVSASVLNELRRKAVLQLEEARITQHLEKRGNSHTLQWRLNNKVSYPISEADYCANITNSLAERFYTRHGAERKEWGLERSLDYNGKALMTTKYCIRYELGCCLKGKNTSSKSVLSKDETLYLHNNGKWFRLAFDCSNCQMHIYPHNAMQNGI